MEEAAATALFASLSDPAATRWLEEEPGFTLEGLWILRSSFYRVFFLSGDLAAYRRAIRGFQERMERPYPQVLQDVEAFEMNFRRYQGGLLTRLIMPAVLKASGRK